MNCTSPSNSFSLMSLFNMNSTIIYVLGTPGAGKGTICTLLAQHYTNIHHLSMGDHLRSLLSLDPSITTSTTFGELECADFSARMQRRELLPADTIIAIAKNAIESLGEATSNENDGQTRPIILLDGFPRSPESAQLADDVLGAPRKVLFFDCPREVAEARFLDRKRSADDGRDVFAFRYEEFEKLNGPILAKYEDRVVTIGTELGTKKTWERAREMAGGIFGELGVVEEAKDDAAK